jgi:hypothetical protein
VCVRESERDRTGGLEGCTCGQVVIGDSCVFVHCIVLYHRSLSPYFRSGIRIEHSTPSHPDAKNGVPISIEHAKFSDSIRRKGLEAVEWVKVKVFNAPYTHQYMVKLASRAGLST